MRARDAQIVDRLLVEKAKAIAEKMHISDFKASDGWLANFKRRHNIKLQRPHGESGAADLEGVDVARTVIGKIITELNYQLEDVLYDMRQQLKGFATFLADNPQFTAEDENTLQRLTDKVAKMLVSRVNHRRQQNITSYFTAT